MAAVFQALTMLLLVALLVIFVFKFIIEPTYVVFFNKPLYIHYYFRVRKLNADQSSFLESNFSFYKKLPSKKKNNFNHRVASFIAKY